MQQVVQVQTAGNVSGMLRDRYEGIKSVLRAALLKGKAYRCALTLLLWHEQPAQESTLCRQESVVILREQL